MKAGVPSDARDTWIGVGGDSNRVIGTFGARST
jgi:hypothetical protein